MSGKRWTIDFVKEELLKNRGDIVTIVEETFCGSRKLATFIDKDYGEFQAIVRNVVQKGVDCKERAILKKKANNLRKYGSETYMQSDDFKKKSKETLKRKYNVDHISKVPEIVQKILETKKRLHPEDLICGMTQAEFARERNIHPSRLSYLINRIGLNEEELIDYIENPKMTDIEKIVSIGVDIPPFNRKHEGIKRLFKPDFVVGDVIIECDGLVSHSEVRKHKKGEKFYHMDKRKEYEKHGFRILQFRGDEIHFKRNIVFSIINNAIGNTERRIYARKTKLKLVSQYDADSFLTENHLMGKFNGASHIGLYLGDELVSLLSYRNFKSKGHVKIERFASKINCMVIGGLSKLMKWVERNVDTKEIQSFVDLRYGNGKSLETLGFEQISEHLGWKWTDKKFTYHRSHCRANMDERKLSEKEYAKEMKLVRIYDAGQRLYMKKLK